MINVNHGAAGPEDRASGGRLLLGPDMPAKHTRMTSLPDAIATVLRQVAAEAVMPRFQDLSAFEIEENPPAI